MLELFIWCWRAPTDWLGMGVNDSDGRAELLPLSSSDGCSWGTVVARAESPSVVLSAFGCEI